MEVSVATPTILYFDLVSFSLHFLERKYKKFIVSDKSLHKKKKKASRSIVVIKVVKKNFFTNTSFMKNSFY